MSGRSVNLSTLFLGRLRPKRLTSTSFLNQRKERNESIWPDVVSNPGPLALESDALPTALRGPASFNK